MPRKRKLWRHTAGKRPYSVAVEEFEAGGNIYVRVWNRREQKHRYRSLRHKDRKRAIDYAERLAARLREGGEAVAIQQATVDRLFRLYRANRTPLKAPATRKEDERRFEMFKRFLGDSKRADSISLGEWERFIHMRRSGAIDSHGKPVSKDCQRPVRARTVEADLRWLKAVLHWGTNWRTGDGTYLLRENPVRGFPIPSEKNPRRPVATQKRLDAVRAVADQVTMEVIQEGKRLKVRTYLREILDIVAGTGRRVSAVLQLQYADLKLHKGPHGSIRWPADTDKEGFETEVPISPSVREAIDRVLEQRPGIGKAYLFPSPKEPTSHVRIELASSWLMKAEKLAGLAKQKGSLWHAYRRAWATARKHLPDTDVAAAGGWRSPATLRVCYQQPDADTMLRVVLEGGELREGGR